MSDDDELESLVAKLGKDDRERLELATRLLRGIVAMAGDMGCLAFAKIGMDLQRLAKADFLKLSQKE